MNFVVLILAAGYSRRFGSDKRLALLPDGRTLLRRALDTALASSLPVAVVLRAEDRIPLPEAVRRLTAERAREGMGCSIADAVAQLPADLNGCLILPFDLPLLQSATISRVASHLASDCIVQPICGHRAGHPVGFGADFFDELRELQGDTGAKSILVQHSDRIHRLNVEDTGIFTDIDTPEDFEKF